MARLSVLLLLYLFVSVEGRVTFPKAEVLDTVDLKGTPTATFKCGGGCRVFSPTMNVNIAIVDTQGNEGNSLWELSQMTPGTFYELPGGVGYTLKNKGADANPKFVFYVVERGAPNYNTKVYYVNAGTTTKITAADSLYTVLSDSGVVRVSDFAGDYSKDLPTVHATGFDSISCRPIFTANSATVSNSLVPILGPIATINVKSTTGAKSFLISGNAPAQSLDKGSTAVFVSPGYTGCTTTTTLYSIARFTDINYFTQVTDTTGLKASVSADYSIAKEADALQLTINDKLNKLWGKNTFTKSDDYTTFKVKIYWPAKEGNTDGFAMQIDLAKGGNAGVPTTTTKKGGPPIQPVTTTKSNAGVIPTTSKSSSLTVLSSAIAVLLCLSR